MIIRQETLLDFLGAPDTQLVIPVYQRVYAWSTRQCDQLWADVMRAGRTGATHFTGTVLYAHEPGDAAGAEHLHVIDGQQRTATLTLLLTALRDYLGESGLTLEGATAEGITQRYLRAPGMPAASDGTPAPKLLLSRVDRATLSAVLEKTELPEEDDLSANVISNYRRFREKMGERFDAEDAAALWGGLQRLVVLAAELEGEDRAQLIFESLNSKGMPLSTADLVRNLLLASASYDEQTRLYDRYWAPVERMYGEEGGSARLAAALHGWLAVTAPKLRVGSADEVYAAFKTYLEDIHRGSLEELLRGLKGFCTTFNERSQSSGSATAQRHSQNGNSLENTIASKKLFGD
ncbi:DUF262 domain-containing protein [Adlercreutzia sp. ZJ242]|uniref:DUF262 domain-containing protein n=1 Tax=Adlercreutzia sp. ZJ242 TaxID=2709409 RepID=UPI0013EA75D5|nr:DUF262 domain-containing protein [Adlercreutzia sp. ZJ242]